MFFHIFTYEYRNILEMLLTMMDVCATMGSRPYLHWEGYAAVAPDISPLNHIFCSIR